MSTITYAKYDNLNLDILQLSEVCHNRAQSNQIQNRLEPQVGFGNI